MRKILVTGAAGFVGRHIVRRFLDFGDEVHAIDSIVPHTGAVDPAQGWPLFDPRHYPSFHFYKEDCRAWFRRRLDTDFDYAFHLAAMVGGRLMIENNPLAVADDLAIDAAYWQWASAARPRKTACFSSSAAYPVKLQGPVDYVLLTEDMISFDSDIGIPDMTYGWAKLTCEYLARLAYRIHGLQSICYRPFSGYGEDQDDAYPFPSICKRAIKARGNQILQVWGSGRQMRDFIHIDDCIDGILTTIDKIHDGDAVNLSTGILTSFLEFATLVSDCLGFKTEVQGTSDMPTGVFARGGNTAKQRKLGFQPIIGLRIGVEQALKYYLSGPA